MTSRKRVLATTIVGAAMVLLCVAPSAFAQAPATPQIGTPPAWWTEAMEDGTEVSGYSFEFSGLYTFYGTLTREPDSTDQARGENCSETLGYTNADNAIPFIGCAHEAHGDLIWCMGVRDDTWDAPTQTWVLVEPDWVCSIFFDMTLARYNELMADAEWNDHPQTGLPVELRIAGGSMCGRVWNARYGPDRSTRWSYDGPDETNDPAYDARTHCPGGTTSECDDGSSNDFDGLADWPIDPGCTSVFDASELGTVECDNGIDDDHDGATDWPSDQTCSDALGDHESLAACFNGFDDDGDGKTDHLGRDPGCSSADDESELGPAQCDNGVDDDRDGRVDWRGTGAGDPGCDSLTDTRELDEFDLTVVFDGPGRVTGGNVPCEARWAGDKGACTLTFPRGATARLQALGFAPGAYRSWIGCAVSGTVCTKVMDRDYTVTARFDPARSYAPRAYFDKGEDRKWSKGPEDYGAMDPDDFFAHASLWWNSRKPGAYSRDCKGRKSAEIADRRELTVKKLMAGKFRYRYCWVVGNQTLKETVRSDHLSAPVEWRHPDKRPYGSRDGFYLRLPDKSKKDKAFLHGIDPRKGSGLYAGPPMHYELMRDRALVYWFFFAFNDRRSDHHQGDWEHLAIRLDDRNLASRAAYYNHLCNADEKRWTAVDVVEGTHPVAYIAGGGHGIWPSPGVTEGFTCAGGENKGVYDTRSRGRQWDTWTHELVDARENQWYGAGVGWGKAGGVGWGPLGPGPWKSNVIPSDWR